MAEAKRAQSSDKRQRILEGALKAFARKGFYNTKVSEIASEAGVADGTIYLYFKNKDDLLISLFEDRMEWVIERLRSELAQVDGDIFSKIHRMIELHFQLATDQADLAEFITVELRQSAKFVKEYKNQRFVDYLVIMEELVAEGQAVGVIRNDVDSRLVSRAMFGALDEVLLQLTLSKAGAMDVEPMTAQVADLFIEGLKSR